jgi:hypothetical protein
MIIAASIMIDAAPETVWEVFSDIGGWAEWNPVCRNCHLIEGDRVENGACLSFAVAPFLLPLRISPAITECRPGRQVTWKGAKWGIRAEHTFRFVEIGDKTRLESIESFSGPMLPAAKLAGIPRRLHILTEKLLQAVKQAAEERLAT